MGLPVGLDCLLLAPPAWYPYQPYSALPSLQAYLRQQGFTARILDLNLGYLDAQLQPEGFRATLDQAEARTFSQRPAFLSAEQQQAREKLYRRLALVADQIAGQLEEALAILRGPGYYDYRRRAEATKVVYWALQAVSACYFPTRFNGNDLHLRLDPCHPAQLLALVASGEENPFLEHLEGALRPALAAHRPRAVGIGICGASQLVGGLTAAAIVKRLAPEVHVIVGGSYFSRLEGAVLRFPQVLSLVDSIVCHEGEIPLAEILSRLGEGRDLAGVPQRIGRAASGEPTYDPRPVPPAIDSLPTADYEGMALDKYLAPLPILGLGSSRGCYWRRCAFCDHGFCYQGDYRERPIEKVIADLAALEARWGAGRYELVDEALEPARLEQLSHGILEAGLEISWFGLARVDRKLTPERFALARRAGCRLLSFGVESHDDGVLRRMAKGTTAALNLRVLRDCRQADIRTHALVFFGFPGESEAASAATMSLVDEHAELFDDASSAPFSVGRQSRVMKEPERFVVELPAGWEDDPAYAYALSIPYRVDGVDTAKVADARAREFKEKVTRRKAALDRTTAFLYKAHFGRLGAEGILAEFEAHGRDRRLPSLEPDPPSGRPVPDRAR